MSLNLAQLIEEINAKVLTGGRRTIASNLRQVLTDIATTADAGLKYIGDADLSSNPNYPAGHTGDLYRASVAGKIGGVSGKSLNVDGVYYCIADNSGGNQATVGTSWAIISANVNGFIPLSGTVAGSAITGNIQFASGSLYAGDLSGTYARLLLSSGASANLQTGDGTLFSQVFQDNSGLLQLNSKTSDGLVSISRLSGIDRFLVFTKPLDYYTDVDFNTDSTVHSLTPKFYVDAAIATATGSAVSDTAYNATTWDGVTTIAASKNAIRDKFVLNDASIAANTANFANYLPLTGGASMTGQFNLSANASSALQPVTLQQMQAAFANYENLVGGWDASGNLFPTTGGTGSGGAVAKGNVWYITVAGTLGGQAVNVSDTITALTNTPGQTLSNWLITEHSFAYTPVSNVLNSGNIFVGSSGNVATGVALSGVIAITNTGLTSFASPNGSGNVVLTTSPILVTPTLGAASATSIVLSGSGGVGYVGLARQSSNPTSSAASATKFFANTTGYIGWRLGGASGDNFVRLINGTITADRAYTLPDASGTIVLDNSSISGLTAGQFTAGDFVTTSIGAGNIDIGNERIIYFNPAGTATLSIFAPAFSSNFNITLPSAGGTLALTSQLYTSPLTTKGDIATFSTVNTRLGVGTDGWVLTADSTTATGLKWAAAASGSQWTTTGSDIYYSTGNVMIGTNAAPLSKFHVVDTSTATPRGILADQYTTDALGSRITMRKARGTFASKTTIVTGDSLGSWTAAGYDGTNFLDAAKILVTSVGVIGTGRTPTKMEFQTMTNVTTGVLTTALTLDEAQKATFASLAGTGTRIVGANSTGLVSEIIIGSGLTLTGSTLTASGGAASPLTTKGDVWVYGSADTRQAVGANGLALVANSAQATGLNYAILTGVGGGTGVDNGAKTITLGGNLTTTGAFNTTFAVSGSNTVTLPNYAGTAMLNSATPTATRIPFYTSTGYSDSANLVWDNTNNRAAIGTTNTNAGDFAGVFLSVGGAISAYRAVSALANGVGFQCVLNNSSGTAVTYSYFNGQIESSTAGAETGSLVFFTRASGTVTAQTKLSTLGFYIGGNVDASAQLHVKATASKTGFRVDQTSGTNDLAAFYSAAPTKLAYVDYTGNIGAQKILASDTTEATSATAGGSTFAGGVGINKKLFVTGNTALAGTLGVTGATTLGVVTINGVTTFNNDVNFGAITFYNVGGTPTTPASGGIVYVQSNVLKFLDTAGVVHTINMTP